MQQRYLYNTVFKQIQLTRIYSTFKHYFEEYDSSKHHVASRPAQHEVSWKNNTR